MLRIAAGNAPVEQILHRSVEPAVTPMISCVMVTRGALYPAAHAIACFRAQSHQPRELLIITDAVDSPVAAHVDALRDPAIRLVVAPPAPLGVLRNHAIAHARGEWLAQWDDDDLYHPDRLSIMAQAMLSDHRAVAVMLQRWTIWWPQRRIFALSGRRPWEGSMLVRRGAMPLYRAAHRGEDRPSVQAMLALHPVLLIDQPALYCYVVHGGNSYDAAHFEQMLRWASAHGRTGDYAADWAHIARHIPLEHYARSLDFPTPAEAERRQA